MIENALPDCTELQGLAIQDKTAQENGENAISLMQEMSHNFDQKGAMYDENGALYTPYKFRLPLSVLKLLNFSFRVVA